MSRNIRLTIEYDGTNYAGWQAQKNALGIQTVIERTLARVAGEQVRLIGAGRTDAGVHARGQVAHYRSNALIPLDALLKAVNHRLPRDICILGIEEVPDKFHARFDALRRTYRYSILNRSIPSALSARFAWHCPVTLPVAAWDRLARELVGTHDFSTFQKLGSPRASPVCTVWECRCWREGDEVLLSITAQSFLRGMVRAIVGTFRRLASDESADQDEAVGRLRCILGARDRSVAGNSAPPQGLCLMEVDY